MDKDDDFCDKMTPSQVCVWSHGANELGQYGLTTLDLVDLLDNEPVLLSQLPIPVDDEETSGIVESEREYVEIQLHLADTGNVITFVEEMWWMGSQELYPIRLHVGTVDRWWDLWSVYVRMVSCFLFILIVLASEMVCYIQEKDMYSNPFWK